MAAQTYPPVLPTRLEEEEGPVELAILVLARIAAVAVLDSLVSYPALRKRMALAEAGEGPRMVRRLEVEALATVQAMVLLAVWELRVPQT